MKNKCFKIYYVIFVEHKWYSSKHKKFIDYTPEISLCNNKDFKCLKKAGKFFDRIDDKSAVMYKMIMKKKGHYEIGHWSKERTA